MERIQMEMKELMQREKESQKMLEEAFLGIGYSIKYKGGRYDATRQRNTD